MAIFVDTFVEAALDTELGLHLPNTGTSWTQVWQGALGVQYTVRAATDDIVQAGAANQGVIYSADATYPSGNYYAELTRTTWGTGTQQSWGIILRLTDVDNFYMVVFNGAAGLSTGADIRKKVGGTYTILGSDFANPTAGQVVRFQVNGSTLKVFYDGVEKASRTDTAITATGKAGIAMGGGAEMPVTNADPQTTATFDNFTADVLAVAVSGTATVAGGGTVVTAATKSVSSAVTVAGGGTISAVASKNAVATATVAGGGAPIVLGPERTRLLERVPYDPDPAVTRTAMGAATADFDAVNLAIAYTAPASGIVKLVLEGWSWSGGVAGDNRQTFWNARENGVDLFPAQRMHNTVDRTRHRLTRIITGLEPGSAHEYTWAGRTDSASVVTNLLAGLTDPAIMEIWEIASADLLDHVEYETSTTYTNTAQGVIADIDAANLAMGITVPDSGKVMVEMEALVQFRQQWMVREGSTVVAPSPVAADRQAISESSPVRINVRMLFEGLTPGQVKTWKWAWEAVEADDATMFAGTDLGSIAMRAFDGAMLGGLLDYVYAYTVPDGSHVINEAANTMELFGINWWPDDEHDGNGVRSLNVLTEVIFVTPDSGEVYAIFQSDIHTGTTSQIGYWALMENGVLVPGSRIRMTSGGINRKRHYTYGMHFTGLEPGTTKTWRWALESSVAGGVSAGALHNSTEVAPHIMEMWDPAGVGAGTPAASGSATVAGGGAPTASGQEGGSQLATVAGGGAIAATATKAAAGAATVAGGGVVTAAGAEGGQQLAVVSGGGALAATASTQRSSGAVVAGGGALLGSGTKAASAVVVASGGGTATATGSAIQQSSGAAVVAGGGVVTASGREGGVQLAIVSGGGALVVAGTAQKFAPVTVGAGGSLLVSGQKQGLVPLVVDGGGTLAAAGIKRGLHSLIVDGGGALIVAGSTTPLVFKVLRGRNRYRLGGRSKVDIQP